MDDLIQSLWIFRKYGDRQFPTCCEHGKLMVDYDNDMENDDKDELNRLGFFFDEELDCWISYKFGDC